ncbi:holo-ACP synthase [Pleionea sediminis]|uniref:holo-ACP synthase n=1 Tax=Pleionea sediminis TaxID=2569479 RepID=UPI001186E8D7|nr:holo-ACP synthase [Pleionea sediminis]
MAIAGIGTDIVEVARIEQSFNRFAERFAQRILSEEELRSKSYKAQPVTYLAKRFAAKEAIVKCLGTGIANGVRFDDFSVLNDDNGKPFVSVSGKAKQLMEERGISKIHISLSDEATMAVAFAVAEI